MLALGLALTIGTGLFVASEFSLINLERSELEARRDRGERGLSNTIKALKRSIQGPGRGSQRASCGHSEAAR